MRWLTFNKVYLALLVIAAISALVVPKPISRQAQGQLETVLGLVNRPVRFAANAVHTRLNPQRPDLERPANAARTYLEIAEENRELRIELANLMQQLKRLQAINDDREAIGSLRPYCRPLRVDGADSALRRSLVVKGDLKGLRAGMAVLYPGGLAGRLDRVGWGGAAQVQLVTDKSSRMTARFGRWTAARNATAFQEIGGFTTLLEGDGKASMVARTVEMKQVRENGLKVGDWAILADSDYPAALQGYRIGQVVKISPSRSTPLYAEVTVEPQVNLLMLAEVMVLVR